jgi:hypothetical protein
MEGISTTSKLAPASLSALGNWCLLTAGFIAPWIALAALPLFRYGIWIDSEPTLVAYHWIAALFALGTFLNQLCSSPPILPFNLILGLLAALIGLSLLLMPFALDNTLTWYGLPQTGQGILSLISFVCYFLGFKQLIDAKYGPFLWVNTVVAVIMVACLTLAAHFAPQNLTLADWSPFVFSAFLAFMALGLLALSSVCEYPYYRIGGSILAYSIILLSSNKTAIVGLFMAFGLVVSIRINPYLQKNARLFLSSIVAMAPLLIIISMAVFSNPLYLPSLWSRVRLIQMVGLEFTTHPWELLTGLGWGSYTDIFLANLTRVPEALYQNGVWNPTWDALERIDFHSHHQVVEALLATGILGAIIVLLLPAIAVYTTDRDKVIPAFIVFFLYATTSSGWFEMPATLPYIALVYAVFWPRQGIWGRVIYSKVLLSFSAMAGILCCLGGMHVFKVGIAYPSTNSFVTRTFGTTTALSRNSAIGASGPGGVHLAYSLRSLANESSHFGNANKEIIEDLFELVNAALSIKNPCLSLTLSLLTVAGDAAQEKDFPWIRPLHQELLPKWRPLLERMLNRAPYRTDLLAPYFRWKMKEGKSQEAEEWCNDLLAQNAQDPVALWFKGLLLRDTKGQESAGYGLMKQALDAGVDRVLPVKFELKETILRRE